MTKGELIVVVAVLALLLGSESRKGEPRINAEIRVVAWVRKMLKMRVRSIWVDAGGVDRRVQDPVLIPVVWNEGSSQACLPSLDPAAGSSRRRATITVGRWSRSPATPRGSEGRPQRRDLISDDGLLSTRVPSTLYIDGRPQAAGTWRVSAYCGAQPCGGLCCSELGLDVWVGLHEAEQCITLVPHPFRRLLSHLTPSSL